MTNEEVIRFYFTPSLPGARNMEIDENLSAAYSLRIPTVRFFTWAAATISLGRNQVPGKQLTLELCKRDGIEVVKRPTGGKELLHGHDLCYSVIWPVDETEGAVDAQRLMAGINGILVAALADLGVKAHWQREIGRQGINKGPCFTQSQRGEITVDGRKLVASAQRIYRQAILQQGSMPLRKPSIDLADYLRDAGNDSVSRLLESGSTDFSEQADETFSLASIVGTFKERFETAALNGMRVAETILKR